VGYGTAHQAAFVTAHTNPQIPIKAFLGIFGYISTTHSLTQSATSATMLLQSETSVFQDLPQLPHLPTAAASDLKKLGWRGVMKTVGRTGKVLVTNHNEPEAVILSVQAYGDIQKALLAAAAQQEPSLDALRQRFDKRLAALQAPDAGKRLRSMMRSPAKLAGRVKAGASY
jgi:prevent-host-death family protein